MNNIQGIILKPKNMADSLINIRKVFSLLQNKNSINKNLLFDEKYVYDANTNYIIELLLEIKKSYRL